jgi:D-lactate dehydrogenase
MKILFYSTKDFEKHYLDAANTLAQEVVFTSETLSTQTVQMAKGFEVVSIFTSDDASADVLKILHNNGTTYIAVRATGHDNVDIEKANDLGMRVANVPDYSPYAIAEHAVALVLALNRKINISRKQIQEYNFTISNLIGFDLHGKTVGLIGVGKIGSIFAKIMHGFGCKILGHDIVENDELTELYGVKYVDLKTLCAQSNIISIHTGLTPDTKSLINNSCIAQMQLGTMLINTGRGACVNTKDVLEGLENGHIGFYGADVYENERGIFFNDLSAVGLKDDMLKKLLAMSNVMITPHQAFATQEALSDIANTTFYNIDCWSENQHSKYELTSVLIEEDEIPGNGNN